MIGSTIEEVAAPGRTPLPAQPERRERGVVDGLLADPGALVERTLGADAATQSTMVRVLLLSILAGTAAFGAAVGFTRGGIQVLYAALKLPLVVLVTALVSTPALTALGLALGRAAELRTDLVRVLATLARGSLMLAALAPVMLVATCVRLAYHKTVMLLVLCCAVAGLTALPTLARALWSERRGRGLLVAAMLLVVGMAGTHSAWLFRPYVVRPQTIDVPFIRAPEGTFEDALVEHAQKGAGVDVPRYEVRP